MFQNYLNSFNDNMYYFDVVSSGMNEKEQLLKLIQKTVKENDAEVFCIDKNTLNKYNVDITIYTSAQSDNWLNKKQINTGTYKSFFSGTTNIEISEFDNLINKPDIETYYLTCNMKTARDIRNAVNAQYASSYVHKTNSYSIEWILPSIYIICEVFILILTWLDIQFQKKENFVLISLGKTRSKILLKNILLDIVFFTAVTAIIYFILNKFIYVQYMQQFAILIFIVFIIINSSLYLSILSFDFKQVLYGANIKPGILSNSYVLKAVIMFLTIILLSSNTLLIAENGNYIQQYKTIQENFSSYSFLRLHTNAGSEEEYLKITNEIFINNYKNGKVGFSVINYEDDSDYAYLMIDKNSSALISDILQEVKVNNDVDFTILYPDKCNDIKNVTSNAIHSFYSVFEEGFENAEYEVFSYHDNYNVTYFDSTDTAVIKAGFNNVRNPVIILCNVSNKLFTENITAYTCSLGHISGDIMYLLSNEDIKNINIELSKLNAPFNLINPAFYITSENVKDRCGQNIAAFSRIVLLNSVVSLLMLILNFAIIITIIKMEFRVGAMELALKKIFGYSLIKRNGTLLLLNLFTAFIGIFSVLIVCIVLKVTDWYIPVIIGVFLVVTEYFIICCYILKTEKAKISKTLKGGSL